MSLIVDFGTALRTQFCCESFLFFSSLLKHIHPIAIFFSLLIFFLSFSLSFFLVCVLRSFYYDRDEIVSDYTFHVSFSSFFFVDVCYFIVIFLVCSWFFQFGIDYWHESSPLTSNKRTSNNKKKLVTNNRWVTFFDAHHGVDLTHSKMLTAHTQLQLIPYESPNE